MKKKFAKRLLSWVMAAAMVISMLPISAMATETGGNVAKIGDTQYATLDDAVEAAPEDSTITLLQDCELTKGFNKTLTFTGNGKITINKQLTSNGEPWMCFGLNGKSRVLTFDGVEVEWNSEVGTSPWLMLSLSGTMNVTNGAKVTFTVDSGSTGSRNAIYMNEGSSINVTNGSSFTINGNETAGKEGQGIQLDQTGAATVNVTGGSTFTIDGTNRGYVNSPVINVTDSTFTVQNCTSNASNGGNFTAVNSKIYYLDNAGHGLSAGKVTIEDSDFVADHNGYYGIYASSGFSVDGTSKVIVTRNSYSGDNAGLKLTSGVTDGRVESGAVVTITDNYCSGLSNNGKCVFEEGVDLTIMDNNNDKGTTSNGGGIYNSGASANLTLPSNAVIYNNHTKTAGDDIFNNTTATITFGKVGSDWALDDCDHLIDGWYDDSANNRWIVHPAGTDEGVAETTHVELFNDFNAETGLTIITGLKALKAAHGTEYKDKTSYPGLDKQVSDANEDWNDDDVDAAAGQEVNFKLTSNVPDDLYNYLNPDDVYPPVVDGDEQGDAEDVNMDGRGDYVLTFHDVMNDMLLNPTSFAVTIDGEPLDGEYYDVYTSADELEAHEDGRTCTFEVEMNLVRMYQDGIIDDADIENTSEIVVSYTATFSSEATAGRYSNEAWVTAPKWETTHDTVYVNTYALNIFKYDQATTDNADGPTGLQGAVFELKNSDGVVINNNIVSGADGYIRLDGLDAGAYTLTETQAPEDYVKSDTPLEISIPKDADADFVVNVRFANSQIPHTGGMGTTMFSIVGGALIATAGVIFVISRKKRARSAA